VCTRADAALTYELARGFEDAIGRNVVLVLPPAILIATALICAGWRPLQGALRHAGLQSAHSRRTAAVQRTYALYLHSAQKNDLEVELTI